MVVSLAKTSNNSGLKTSHDYLAAISSLPGLQKFSKLYQSRSRSSSTEFKLLRCIYKHVSSDNDGDGVRDWTIVHEGQLLSHLVPHDRDWDNDNIDNVMDSSPWQFNTKVELTGFPQHLRLENISQSPINKFQHLIFAKCNILAVNHSDQHALQNLVNVLDICSQNPLIFRKSRQPLVLYSFLSHGTFGQNIALFHPSINAISISGSSSTIRQSFSVQSFKETFYHEVGHYIVFQYLSPEKLAQIAVSFGHWPEPPPLAMNFYSHYFFTPFKGEDQREIISSYARNNIHEWFGEYFSHQTIHNRSGPFLSWLAVGPERPKALIRIFAKNLCNVFTESLFISVESL